MRNVVVLMSILLISCTTIEYNRLTNFEKNSKIKYPSVNVVVNGGYVFTDVGFANSNSYYYRDKTTSFIISEFKESGNFPTVKVSETKSPYRIEINTRRIVHDRDSFFWKLLFNIVTLGLIPVNTDYTFYADITIKKGGEIVDGYHYSTDVTDTSALYYSVQGYKKNALKIIMSKFFKDIENKNPFIQTQPLQ